MNTSGFRVCLLRDRKATLSPQRHRSHVPIAMTDKNTKKGQRLPQCEKELKYQQVAGETFFNNVVRKIISQTHEEMRRDDEEEADEGGSSENLENQLHQLMQ